jgi:spore germination cell wall hydrolase CwlJ-like protein
MNASPRILAVATALVLGPSIHASQTAPFVIRFNAPAAADQSAPISFAVPKYTLTPTEREIVAACLVLEAANQGDYGMRSVMAVIRNRARAIPELFAPTVLRQKQFSALNRLTAGRESYDKMLARARRDATWPDALKIVDDATQDTWYDPTAGATHYTRNVEQTHWTSRLAKTVTIGAHSFYR